MYAGTALSIDKNAYGQCTKSAIHRACSAIFTGRRAMYNTGAVVCKHSIKRHFAGVQSLATAQGAGQEIVHLIAVIAHGSKKKHPAGIAESDVSDIFVKR